LFCQGQIPTSLSFASFLLEFRKLNFSKFLRPFGRAKANYRQTKD